MGLLERLFGKKTDDRPARVNSPVRSDRPVRSCGRVYAGPAAFGVKNDGGGSGEYPSSLAANGSPPDDPEKSDQTPDGAAGSGKAPDGGLKG